MANKQNVEVYASGIGASGLLGVAFVILKLMHIIDWSWFWVLLPFWWGFALLLALGAIGAVVWLLVFIFAYIAGLNRRFVMTKKPKQP